MMFFNRLDYLERYLEPRVQKMKSLFDLCYYRKKILPEDVIKKIEIIKTECKKALKKVDLKKSVHIGTYQCYPGGTVDNTFVEYDNKNMYESYVDYFFLNFEKSGIKDKLKEISDLTIEKTYAESYGIYIYEESTQKTGMYNADAYKKFLELGFPSIHENLLSPKKRFSDLEIKEINSKYVKQLGKESIL